jgi:uncharacterized membrane protein YedE/YeeE
MNHNLQALAGGLMIGAAAAILLLAGGRIAGISGVLGRLVVGDAGPRGWRIAFFAGLVLAAVAARLAGWSQSGEPSGSYGTVLLAGLLVGLGTALASGCTSGHGVCGLANLSPRSLVATSIFMATAALTVYLVRHVG